MAARMRQTEERGTMASKGGAQLAATAFHEAGHAFMAWRQGVPVYKATIIPGDDTLGHVRHGKVLFKGDWKDLAIGDSDRTRMRAERLIMICLAGPEAQCLHR